MTLKEWCDKASMNPGSHGDAIIVAYGRVSNELYHSLWALSDYYVSSVAGGGFSPKNKEKFLD